MGVSNKLTGTLPPEYKDFPRMFELEFNWNMLTGEHCLQDKILGTYGSSTCHCTVHENGAERLDEACEFGQSFPVGLTHKWLVLICCNVTCWHDLQELFPLSTL